jgi:nitrite reductase/ring-hydroxylating ferredoxin subunit
MDEPQESHELQDSPCDQGTMSRRLVNGLLGLGAVSALTGLMGTALAYLWPMAGAAGSTRLVGREGPLLATALGDDEGLVARSSEGKILVVRKGDELIGLLATCTHLGCTVAWNAASQQVECPCHGARYNLRGEVLRGPARDPLGRIELSADEAGISVVRRLDS